jgi:hypothetical protein
MDWDVFICHASEDKEEIALPLAVALTEVGTEVWYDEFTLTLGDSLRSAIDRGLAKSRFGIVILSHNFFAKKWPQYELNGLITREINSKKVVLPVWHKITRPEIEQFSPPLADKLGISTGKGMDAVLKEVLKVVQPKSSKDRYNEFRNRIKEAYNEVEKNRPISRIEGGPIIAIDLKDAKIASNLVALMRRARKIGREIYNSSLKTEHIVILTDQLNKLQNKIDWFLYKNG